MSEILSPSQINQAVCYASPGMSSAEGSFLMCAEIFRSFYLKCRKIYLMANNPISFAAGSALSLAVGQNNVLDQVARVVLGSLSILRCGEDLHKFRALYKKCRRIVSGKEYIPVKGDRFNINRSKSKILPQFLDEVRYAHKMRMERIALLITTLGEIAVVFGELMLHMGDVYIAFNEDCVTEVFIHSRDLWDELTSDESYLVQQLKDNEGLNDWLLGKSTGLSGLCTQVFLSTLVIPSQIRSALPDFRDVTQAVSDAIDEVALNVKLNIQDYQIGFRSLCGIDPSLTYNEYYSYKKGSLRDPRVTRWINPPKRIAINGLDGV